MDGTFIKRLVQLDDSNKIKRELMNRRDNILKYIEEHSDIPQEELRKLLGELFDLNVAIGDDNPQEGRDEN